MVVDPTVAVTPLTVGSRVNSPSAAEATMPKISKSVAINAHKTIFVVLFFIIPPEKCFYIFLDIDGVMYDWDWIIEEINSGKMKKGELEIEFSSDDADFVEQQLEKWREEILKKHAS